MIKRIGLALTVSGALWLWAGAAQAQQHLGNGVYACGGAAQAGPNCEDDDEDSAPSRSNGQRSGYTDNDYVNNLTFDGYREQWGALATGQPDSPAYIIGYNNSYGTGGDNTREEAEAKALSQCEYTASGRTQCEIVETFVNACGSIAFGKDGNVPGRRFIGLTPIQGRPGEGRFLEAARNISRARARDLCEREQGAGQCEIRQTVCTPAVANYR